MTASDVVTLAVPGAVLLALLAGLVSKPIRWVARRRSLRRPGWIIVTVWPGTTHYVCSGGRLGWTLALDRDQAKRYPNRERAVSAMGRLRHDCPTLQPVLEEEA